MFFLISIRFFPLLSKRLDCHQKFYSLIFIPPLLSFWSFSLVFRINMQCYYIFYHMNLLFNLIITTFSCISCRIFTLLLFCTCIYHTKKELPLHRLNLFCSSIKNGQEAIMLNGADMAHTSHTCPVKFTTKKDQPFSASPLYPAQSQFIALKETVPFSLMLLFAR